MLDPYTSNGTCYWQAGKKSNSQFIPCGNVAFGNIPCCESGHWCLSSRACFGLGVTYLAGCTDSQYEDESCPNKGDYGSKLNIKGTVASPLIYTDQSWTGLVYCSGSSGEWSGCPNPSPPSGQNIATVFPITKTECTCTSASREALFTDAATLANWVSLPASTGMTVSIGGGLDGKIPYQSPTTSDTTSMAASSTNDSGSTTKIASAAMTTDSANPTSTSSSPSTPTPAAASTHISSGQIAGAAAGGAIAFIILLTLFSTFMQRYYRKKRATVLPSEEKQDRPDSKMYTDDILAGNQSHGGLPSPSYKSELPADSVQSPSMQSMKTPSTRFDQLSVQSEVEGSPAPGSVGRPLQDGGFEMPGHKGTYYEMSA